MASPVGEDNWVDFVDHQLRGATDLESRVKVIETFRRAVQAEPGSLKVWMAYCEYFWSLYSDCQPGSDAGWPIEEQHLGRETFTLDHALNLWQEGYEAVQYRLSDSHQLWNRWVSLEMELLARTATEAGVRRITHLYKNRLAVPHAAWDNTSQMFSSFLSEYNRANYESEMLHVTANARDAKRLYEMRDPWEMKLNQAQKAGDIQGMKAIMTDYIDFEIRQAKSKKDHHALTNIRICLGLFSRALTGIMSSDEATWLNFLVFVSTWHSDVKMGRVKIPSVILPNMLDVLQRAVHHVPWSGTVWARYILAAEEAGLGFTDIERIKHAATSCAQLDRDGMGGVLEMYSAWCGYLKRTAMNPNATEEAVDLAEVGLPSALEDVRHWGKRRYGDAYQGDPNFRLEKILIQFLTEKKDDIDEARNVWEQLSVIPLHANSYDFWLAWFLWEMLVFASTKSKNRSPTPATVAQGLRVPSFATRVFIKALNQFRTLDWPERIMDVYLQHCNDYELAETLREAQDTIYKTRKGVARRRAREAAQAQAEAQAQAQAAYAAQAQTQPQAQAQHQPQQHQHQQQYQQQQSQYHPMTDAPQAGTSPGSKRKREDGPVDGPDDGAKRAKSETIMGAAELKRDRENTSVFVRNLPEGITQTKLRQFFREYGHINNIDLQKSEGAPAVALIEFRSPEDALTALLRDGKYLGESVIQVSPATDCTLFVTNYPPEADEQYIRNLFKHCGDIHSIRFPSLKYNTKRRFCYVSFRDRSFAAAATQLDGKPLEEGKYKLQAKFSDPGHRQVRQGAQAEERELHVNNLPRAASEEDVEGLFQKAGNVVSVRLTRNMGGVSTGTAFVVMETKEQAAKAIEILDKVIFGNHPLKVEVSKPPTRKTTATSRADGEAEGSPESSASGSGPSHVSGPEIAARTIAILGIPDTMNDARVRSIVAPIGTINKLVLHPQHGGAVVEFADAATAGKASLVINSTEIEGGKKLRVGSVGQLFKEKAEKRRDRIDLPHQQLQKKQDDSKTSKKGKTAAELMPPPPPIRRPPVLGKAGAKRGLGFVVPVSKAQKEKNGAAAAKEGSGSEQQVNGTGPSTSAAGPAAPAPAPAPPVAQKSNADFKRLFLEGKK